MTLLHPDVPAFSDDPAYPYFPPRRGEGDKDFETSSAFRSLTIAGRLPELHLYDGNRCNRACPFCCVHGAPEGEVVWHAPYTDAVLDYALQLVDPAGRIKFYGGEPTMDPGSVIRAASYLRAGGFTGSFRIFSNGDDAPALLRVLEAVPDMHATLNYSVVHGLGVERLSSASLLALQPLAGTRIFCGHASLAETGRHTQGHADSERDFGPRCPGCHPVLRSDGILHGCPFAVEDTAPRFVLAHAGTTPPRTAIGNFMALARWQRAPLVLATKRSGASACTTCRSGEVPDPTLADLT